MISILSFNPTNHLKSIYFSAFCINWLFIYPARVFTPSQSTAINSNKTHRNILIDILRGISISLVLSGHLGLARLNSLTSTMQERTGDVKAWFTFASNGAFGVTIFFVLSGFLISSVLIQSTENWKQLSFRDFYVRRAGRILPLLSLSCLIGIMVMDWASPLAQNFDLCFSAPTSNGHFWASIATFTFNWYRIMTENSTYQYGYAWGVLWSLSIEEQFYLFYPILLFHLKSSKRSIVAISLVILSGLIWRTLIYVYYPRQYQLSLNASFGAFDQIAIGCLLYFVHQKLSSSGQMKKFETSCLMLAGIVIIAWTYWFTSLNNSIDRVYAPTLLSLGVFLFLLGGLQLRISETFFTRILSWPGQFSYEIYLLHGVVLFLSRKLLILSNPWYSYGLFILVNIPVGYIAFYGFGKPVNHYIRLHFSSKKV